MTSPQARLRTESPTRPVARTRIPPVFVLGVVMMIAVVGGLMLRGAPKGDGAATQNGTSPVPASNAGVDSPAVTAADPGISQTAQVASQTDASPTPAPPLPPDQLTGYSWPLVNAVVTLPFGPSPWGEFRVDGQLFHDGVDMATQCGDNVHAAHDGVVLAAGRHYDDYMGWTGSLTPYYNLLDAKHWWDSLPIVIVIDDGDGYRAVYAHESRTLVKPGQHVKAGQVIGYEGATGNASGCHVHFGLFSPVETATFSLDPAVAARDQMPAQEIARIDPLLVLPFRCEIEEMRSLRPGEAAGCPPLPSASPSPGKSARATPSATPTITPTAAPSASPG